MNYESMIVAELKDICKLRGIRRYSKLKKADIISKIKHADIELAVSNEAEVKEILAETNERVRNLSYDKIKEIAESAERTIEHIPFSLRSGCSLYLKCSLPNSYKYAGTFTNVCMIRRKYEWFIKRISRDYCNKKAHGGGSKIIICLPQTARNWLAKKTVKNVEVVL